MPEGLRLDPATGKITGSLDTRGEYRVTITVTNSLVPRAATCASSWATAWH